MPCFGAERLASSLEAIDPGWRGAGFCVALSGGLDSTVLLHALAAIRAAVAHRTAGSARGSRAAARLGRWAEPAGSPAARSGIAASKSSTLGLAPPARRRASRPPRARRAMRRLAAARRRRVAADCASSRRPARDGPDPAPARRRRRGSRGNAGARARSAAAGTLRPLLDFDRAELAEYAARAESRLAARTR